MELDNNVYLKIKHGSARPTRENIHVRFLKCK